MSHRFVRRHESTDLPQPVYVEEGFMLGVQIALGFIAVNFLFFLFVVVPILWMLA